MKEITIKLQDKIADYIAKDAAGIGLTPEDLIRCIVGRYVQEEIKYNAPSCQDMSVVPIDIREILDNVFSGVEKHYKSAIADRLKGLAERGALSCKNCTMKIKPEDIEAGKCGSCGATLKEALGERLG